MIIVFVGIDVFKAFYVNKKYILKIFIYISIT